MTLTIWLLSTNREVWCSCPQCSRPASCSSSCCAARSTQRPTRTRPSCPSGSSGRPAMAYPTKNWWDWLHTSKNTSTNSKWFTALCFCVTVQDDLQRRVIWESNKRIIEDNNQGFLMGMRPFTMAMNKYGDLVRSCVFPCYVKVSTQDIKSSILSKYNDFTTLKKTNHKFRERNQWLTRFKYPNGKILEKTLIQESDQKIDTSFITVHIQPAVSWLILA